MKKMIFAAAAALLISSPVLACEMHKDTKGGEASLTAPTKKEGLKTAKSKAKAGKSVASTSSKSAKI